MWPSNGRAMAGLDAEAPRNDRLVACKRCVKKHIEQKHSYSLSKSPDGIRPIKSNNLIIFISCCGRSRKWAYRLKNFFISAAFLMSLKRHFINIKEISPTISTLKESETMIDKSYDLGRFIAAQKRDYQTALAEIIQGRKRSHWMWYIFPQIRGLGMSSTSYFYGIENLEEARAFFNDPYLGKNLLEISQALLRLDTNNARAVMGSPDDLKLRSSMTLFSLAAPEEPVFKKVLEKYYGGAQDPETLRILGI